MRNENRLKSVFFISMLLIFVFFLGSYTTIHAKQSKGSLSNLKIATLDSELNDELAPSKFVMEQDTLPFAQNRSKIITNNNGKTMEIEMIDDQITFLKIDGKEIPKEDFDQYESEIQPYRSNSKVHRFSFGDNGLGWSHGGSMQMFNFDNMDSMFHNFGFFQNPMMSDSFPSGMFHGFKHFDFNSPFFSFPDNFSEGFQFEFGPDGLDQYDMLDLQQKIQDMMGDMEGSNGNRRGPSEAFRNPDRDKNLEDIIGAQLNRDGFLIPDQENKVELTGKHLKINGEKQPLNIWKKYKSLFETETGVPLHKKSRLEFSIIGKESNKRYKAF